MLISELVCQPDGCIIIINHDSLLSPLFNVHVYVKNGNSKIIFWNLVFFWFFYLFSSLLYTLFSIARVLVWNLENLLFLFLFPLLLATDLGSCPSFTNQILFMLLDLPSFFHSQNCFLNVFNTFQFLLRTIAKEIYLWSKCVILFVSFILQLVYCKFLPILLRFWQLIYLFFHLFYVLFLFCESRNIVLCWGSRTFMTEISFAVV